MHGSRGFTLVELLLGMSLMLIISSAVLTTFERFVVHTNANQNRVDDIERGRNALDLLARDARNASGYQTQANQSGSAVVRAGKADFVFGTVDPLTGSTSSNPYSVRTVRYCLSTTANRLFRQTHADAVTPSTACPDPSWSTTATVPYVVNAGRGVFTYDSVLPSRVTSAIAELYIDATPGRIPRETTFHTGVFLRNANRLPAAEFSVVAAPDMHVQLNGSASSDPDGGLLTYRWEDNGTLMSQTSPVVEYVATAGSHTFTLTVTDSGGLTSTSSQTITVKA
jgi:prepilin-type N-terminal cleavage/methylation domain-containing protein